MSLVGYNRLVLGQVELNEYLFQHINNNTETKTCVSTQLLL